MLTVTNLPTNSDPQTGGDLVLFFKRNLSEVVFFTQNFPF